MLEIKKWKKRIIQVYFKLKKSKIKTKKIKKIFHSKNGIKKCKAYTNKKGLTNKKTKKEEKIENVNLNNNNTSNLYVDFSLPKNIPFDNHITSIYSFDYLGSLNINNHSLNDDEKLEAVEFFKIKCNHSPFSELFFIDRDPTIIYEDYDNDINNKRLRDENCETNYKREEKE